MTTSSTTRTPDQNVPSGFMVTPLSASQTKWKPAPYLPVLGGLGCFDAVLTGLFASSASQRLATSVAPLRIALMRKFCNCVEVKAATLCSSHWIATALLATAYCPRPLDDERGRRQLVRSIQQQNPASGRPGRGFCARYARETNTPIRVTSRQLAQ